MALTTIYPDEDAHIYKGSADTNYGSLVYMDVAKDGSSGGSLEVSRVLMQYDISNLLDVPVDNMIINLYMYCNDASDVIELTFSRLDATFDESTLTWTNQPDVETFDKKTGTWSSTGWHNINISDMFKTALADGDTDIGIQIRFTNESHDGTYRENGFNSKESAYDPYLSVTYDTYSQTRLKGSLCKNLLDKTGWGEITMTDHNCPSPCDAATFTFKTAWGSTYTTVLLDVGDTQQYDSGSMHHSFKLYSMSADSAPCDNLAAATIEEKYWEDDCYVKTTGDNDRNGTSWTEAWDTVTQAATEAFDGQEVHIGFGTYSGESKVTPDNFGTTSIKYTPESVGGGGTGSVTIPL